MNRSEKTLLAFMVGAAAGLAAGFLFAPAKGEKTRQALSETALSSLWQVLQQITQR